MAKTHGRERAPQKKHFIRGTDVEVERVMMQPGKKKVWMAPDGVIIDESKVELR